MNRKFSKLWLQEELATIYEKLKDTRAKNESIKLTHQSEVRKLESTIQEQTREINSLIEKIKLLDSKKIRDAVIKEATNHYESKISELNSENDKLRDQYNNLRYESAILKCSNESRETDYSRMLEKIKFEHLVEIDLLQSKIKNSEKEAVPFSDDYALELKSTKREVLELNTKIKILLSECDELRAQNENLTLQMNGLLRTNSKQSLDHANNLRTLEAEKIKVIRQLEVCEKELFNAREHRKTLNVELQSSRQEILSLKSKLEENERNSNRIMTNIQDELVQIKSEKEMQQAELADEINRLRKELQESAETLTHERHIVLLKEQDMQNDLGTARQQFWKLSNDFQQEKEKLERKIRELEIYKNNEAEQFNQNMISLQQKLHDCLTSKIEIETEFINLKQHVEGTSQNTTNEKSSTNLIENIHFQKEIQDLKDKFQLLAASCSKQNEQKETCDPPQFPKNVHMTNEHEVLQMKLTWEQQKLNFQQRLEELESKLRECKNVSIAEKRELEFKIKQHTGLISKMKDKVDSQKEKLHSQKELLEKCVSIEIHQQVRNQLFDLQRRLEDYKRLITNESGCSSIQMPNNKMLSDIKNIDFKTFSHAVMNVKDPVITSEISKEHDRSFARRKSAAFRRRFSKTKEKNNHTKSISPVISSSSDIDLENL